MTPPADVSFTMQAQLLQDIAKRLERKATFLKAVLDLRAAAAERTVGQHAVLPLVARVHTLLKSRYSNVEFWRTGLKLFAACQALFQSMDADQAAKMQQYVRDADAVLREDGEEGPSAPTTAEQLADMLMSNDGATLVMPAESHFDDAGPIVDDAQRWRRAQGIPEAASASTGATGDAAGQPAAGDAAAPARSRAQMHAELQASILQGLQAVHSGMEAVTRGTEAIERELENVLSIIARRQEQDQRPARPPASKRVLRDLPKVVLTDANLTELAEGKACAVCTEDLKVGDEVQILPCQHFYHPPCLAPWVAKHNSCPVCRQELPTDDPHYEAAKEQRAEEEAERRGAENAVRGGEFFYL